MAAKCTRCGSVGPFYFDKDAKRNRPECRKCFNAANMAARKRREADDDATVTRIVAAPGLASFGTPIERASVEALIQHGSLTAAATALQLEPRQLRAHLSELERRAATRGYSPANDMTKTTPEGFAVKGVSTLYGADGSVRGQWVKTKRDEDSKLAAMLAALGTLGDAWPEKPLPVPAPKHYDSDLLCVYPLGDPHFGMLSWAPETGQNFDLKIAERNTYAAVDRLVALAPMAETGLLINLGDFFHADSKRGTTTAGTPVDTDGRWPKILSVGIRTMRRLIDLMLTKHKRVIVICEIGNHDDHMAIVLAIALAQFYEHEPRVEIDTSPAKFHWHKFGANLIGVTHGDTVKGAELPSVMAVDQPKWWGETEYRYWYCGHVHHDSLKEFRGGVYVETFRTLAPSDDWHRRSGYRSGRDMKLDVLHIKYGRINRHIVGIDQLVPAA